MILFPLGKQADKSQTGASSYLASSLIMPMTFLMAVFAPAASLELDVLATAHFLVGALHKSVHLALWQAPADMYGYFLGH